MPWVSVTFFEHTSLSAWFQALLSEGTAAGKELYSDTWMNITNSRVEPTPELNQWILVDDGKGIRKTTVQLKLTPQETITYRYLPTKMMDVWKMYHFQVITFLGIYSSNFRGGQVATKGLCVR